MCGNIQRAKNAKAAFLENQKIDEGQGNRMFWFSGHHFGLRKEWFPTQSVNKPIVTWNSWNRDSVPEQIASILFFMHCQCPCVPENKHSALESSSVSVKETKRQLRWNYDTLLQLARQ